MSLAFELLVFDWDGTLMDSAATIAASLGVAGDELGLASRSDAERRDVIGLGMREAVLKLYPDLSDLDLRHFTDAYRQHFLLSGSGSMPLFPGVLSMLQSLSQREELWLAVATGKGRNGLKQALAESKSAHFFHGTRTAEETCSKPDPQMLHELMGDFGVEPKKVLMIGDTEYDLDMAKRAGVSAIGVSYGAHEYQRFSVYSPIACVHSVSELDQWFKTHL